VSDRDALVVCGASAGGLEAFSQLLAALPDGRAGGIRARSAPGPEHASMMPQLLQHHTTLPVTEATDGMEIERGRVYVAPPGMNVDVHDGRIGLSRRPDGALAHPIDHSFRSLAQLDGRAIAVVMSGTGADGAAGIRDVRARRDHDGAGAGEREVRRHADRGDRHERRRRRAAADRARGEIARFAEHAPPMIVPPGELSPDTPAEAVRDEHLQRLFAMLRTATGVDFRQYKMPTIERRLQRRLLLHKLTRLEDYVQLMLENPDEVTALYADILIHVTRFFREPNRSRRWPSTCCRASSTSSRAT
jgi:two-component system CheB/CheR fusion protein